MYTITNWIAWVGIAVGGAMWVEPNLCAWAVSASHGAALFMPVLGCVWLGVQIWYRIWQGK